MIAFIPENLNLASEKHKDKYYYFLSSITYRRIFNKSIKENDFVPISSKILHNILNSRYKERVNELLKMGIVETDGKYYSGEKSKGYMFTPDYQRKKLKRVNITDSRIISKVNKFRSIRAKKIALPQHKHLFNCLLKIKIEYNQAIEFVDENIIEDKKNSVQKMMIEFIKNIKTNWYWSVDSNGRVHSNASNFPRGLRKFLRWENSSLVEIDIANSQPFLFNFLIHDYIYLFPSYVTTFSNEICLYKQLTSEGKFYDYLMEEFCINEDKSKFKKRFFAKVFYSSEEFNYPKCYFDDEICERERFKFLFPNIAGIISYYKRNDYKYLANKLQQIESEIMIGRIVAKLAEKNIFVLTIHDSILTTPDNTEPVRKIIMNEFKKYNLQPTLKIKD